MTKTALPIPKSEIESKIHTIRGAQVMLDSDLAALYRVETKVLNQAVKRNSERFPSMFMFQLTSEEHDSLRSQIVTLNTGRGRHRKYLPYAFTEQGVAMLSAVLRSATAVRMSIAIIHAFVEMRHFLALNGQIFQRIDSLEKRQVETDAKIEKVLNALGTKEIAPRQGVFFDKEVFDAYRFVADLVRKAKRSIILIDNYVDDTVLTLFSKRKKGVSLSILTKTVPQELALDVTKHHSQFPPVTVAVFPYAHDRFLILDECEVYHFGASLKDLGKRWFAFSRLDEELAKVLISRATGQ